MKEDYLKLKSVTQNKAKFLNAFDSLTGIFQSKPAVFVKPNTFLDGANKKILVIRNDRIGDLVLSMGAMKSLRKAFPKAHIAFMGSRLNSSLMEGQNLCDEIITLTPFWQKGSRNLSSLWRYITTLIYLRKQRYDAGIDLRCSCMNIIFLLWMAKVKKRISYYNFNGGKAFLTDPVFYDKHEHNTLSLHKLLEKGFSQKMPFCLPEVKGPEFSISGGKYVCICPGAGNRLQQWNPKNFKELAVRLAKFDYHVLVCGSKKEAKLVRYICHNNSKAYPMIDIDLRSLATIFSQKACKAVIACDGGAMHISWASGAKTIALWGPTDIEHIGPLKNSIIINPEMKCKPCLRLRKSCIYPKGMRCMDKISIKEVLSEI